MVVSVYEMLGGERHGMEYSYNVRSRYACGVEAKSVGGTQLDALVGHYTDWRDRVTCKRCLRALERTEAKRDGIE
jgi:hypothetical protein